MEDFTKFVCYRLKTTIKKVEKHIGEALNEYGVTMAQSFILFALLEKDGCTLTEIGAKARIDNSSLTTMVDRLEKEGLVERRLFAQDRRVVALYLTDKGRELGQKVFSTGSEYNKLLTEKLGENAATFFASLDALNEVLDQD
ncbi:MAG: MarR family transcriptional regulator [Bacillota bacterium]|nr:MarR family transcriptional regulator [Bacillota bacterium]